MIRRMGGGAGLKGIWLVAGVGVLLAAGEAAGQGSSQLGWDAQELFQALRYRNVGPSRGGRVTAVAGVVDQPSTFYLGATGGGVWKTTDYGENWVNVSDGFFETGSIGAIRVAPSRPEVVYVGTGSDALRSNVITGRGVYKSEDAGKTWRMIGLREAGQIGAVEVHPRDPDIVFVAAIGQAFGPNPERGVFRSRDGGSTWEKVLYLSDRTGAVDLEFCPADPEVLYAVMWRAERKPWTIISGGPEGGVYKSTDGGDSWRKLTRGLPRGVVGKGDLAVSAADPDRLYLLLEAGEGQGGLYRSDDRGENFRLVSAEPGLLDRPFYYTNVDADPRNADVVYVNSTRFYRSRDGGKSWQRLRTPHGDNHDMWIHPHDSNLFIQANDGGANITRDGGKTWSSQLNQPTAELYQVNVDDRFPYWLYAGQQDNTTIRVPSLPPHPSPAGPQSYWESVGGCETGPAVPKPGQPHIVYSNCKGRFGRYNHLTGQEKQYYVGAANLYGHNPRDLRYRFQRVAPIHLSPHDPGVIYHASQYLHRSRDEGVTWETISPDLTANEPDKQVISGEPITRDITGEEFYSTIYAVQESPLRKGLIWVGANDGPVHVTLDGGGSWRRVTPPELPPGGRVQTIEASPHRPEKAYIAVYRYLLGDWQPYIFKTQDYGQSWKRLTDGRNGIPRDSPTRVVREDPEREGLLYAGTEFGMFISFDDGESWQPFQLNLPVTPVTDIKVVRGDLVLSTMGRSFWILDDLSPVRQIQKEVLERPLHLFQPRVAYRMRYRPSWGNPAGPEYPPPGVYLDYFLREPGEEEVQLEIRDEGGRPIRRLRSSPEPSSGPEEDSMQGLPAGRTSPVRLAKAAGLHRIRWDLRHEASAAAGRPGPLVRPGRYELVLTQGSSSQSVFLEVRMDPRLEKDGVSEADLRAQESLSLQILSALEEAKRLAGRISQALQSQESSGVGQDPGAERRRELRRLEGLLITAEGRYPQPMLIDQLTYLYDMLDQADQKPGLDAFQRLEELRGKLARLREDLERLEAEAQGGGE